MLFRPITWRRNTMTIDTVGIMTYGTRETAFWHRCRCGFPGRGQKLKAARDSLRHEQQQMEDDSAGVMSNIRESLSWQCSAVGDLTASSRTLYPGKLTRWTGAGRQTQDDKSPVTAYRRRTGEGEDHVRRWGRSGWQYMRWTVGGQDRPPVARQTARSLVLTQPNRVAHTPPCSSGTTGTSPVQHLWYRRRPWAVLAGCRGRRYQMLRTGRARRGQTAHRHRLRTEFPSVLSAQPKVNINS